MIPGTHGAICFQGISLDDVAKLRSLSNDESNEVSDASVVLTLCGWQKKIGYDFDT